MSKTYFLRTEPRTTSSSLEPGIAARIYDPLWLLGRQWQLGELLGDDAGSPVSAGLDAETATLSRYRRSGATVDDPYDPRALPLEALVEANPIRSAGIWTIKLRIDTGRAFLGALEDAGMSGYGRAFRAAFALERADAATRANDPAGARLLEVAAGRIPDGRLLFDGLSGALRAGNALPTTPTVAANDVSPVWEAATAWLAWCDDTLLETGTASAWRSDTLDYGFTVSTAAGAAPTMLDADGYRGGSLDWHSFDARPVAAPSGFAPLPTLTGLPTGVRFRGMPNARWWEFEDASVDLGNVDAGASDVARLALLEFALVYGNDFFAIPLRLAVGSLCRITSLVVADTFGMRLKIGPAAHGTGRLGAGRWSMFTLSERDPAARGGQGVSDLFFLPPVAHQILADAPVEEVLLLRDEMANLAWAVERRYEGARGAAVERIEEAMRGKAETVTPAVDATLRYTLGTAVPPYWFPLVPVQTGNDVRLDLQQMANRPASVVPLGRFLDLNGPTIPDADVPREGALLLRDYVLTRWTNGATLVWSRQRKRVGRGEGSSGLRFDVADHT